MNTIIYQSSIIYRKKLFFQVLIYLIVVLFLIFITIYNFKYQALQLLCLILFILPLVLIKKLIKYFTFEIEIITTDKSLSFSIKERHKDFTDIQLSEIKQYKILFVNRRFADIIIYWDKNRKSEYSFLREKVDDNKISGNDLIEKIHCIILKHNSILDVNDKIELLPSFYASNFGVYTILFMIILFIIAVILHIIYSIKTLPFTLFFSAAIIIQLMLRRKTDLEFYKKMK